MNKDEVLSNACKALVGLFSDQIKSGQNCVHSRIFNYILHKELTYVGCGKSSRLSDGERAHPEHVVPCIVLIRETFRLLEEGEMSEEEIALILRRHWKIVQITKDEAKTLDSELKLKSRMPDGWRFEDGDPFARLHAAGISFVQTSYM